MSVMDRLWFHVFEYTPQKKTAMINLLNLIPSYKTDGFEIYKFDTFTYYFIRLDYEQTDLVKEICLLRYMGQRNIGKININITSDKTYIYYMRPNNIDTALTYKILTIECAEQIITDVGAAICYLHQKNIAHMNIVLTNISIYCTLKTMYVNLINFNKSSMAIPIKPQLESKFDIKCPPDSARHKIRYTGIKYNIQMPPEVLCDKPLNVKIDIWMYGCIMMYLLADKHICDFIWDTYECDDLSPESTYCHPYTNRIITCDMAKKYLNVVRNESLINDVVNKILDNSSKNLFGQLTNSKQALYKILIRLCLHPNPNKRLSSTAIRHSLQISVNQIFYGSFWTYKCHLQRRKNGYKNNFIVETDREDHIYIIRDISNTKKSFIMERNILLEEDHITENIDSLWDMFESTLDTRHLHNMTVQLFSEFAFRVSILNSDNIWLYLLCCKFLTHNMYYKTIGLTEFMTEEGDSSDINEMRLNITIILTTLRFDILNEYFW